jgi:c-di-GMP-binding flagellar brake protein YcgR
MDAAEPIRERRQGPRAAPPASAQCRLEVRTRVRLIDISLTGALLATDVALPIGTHGQLRSSVSAATFTPSVEVRRVNDTAGHARSGGLGAMFTTMDERSRRGLEEFLRKANS